MNETKLSIIIQGCKKRNRKSQSDLYRLYYAYGMSVCIRYAKDEDQAILILNDGFLKVFNHIKKYDVERTFKPWFRRIIVNTAINYLKKEAKEMQKTNLDDARQLAYEESILSSISYKEIMGMVQSLSAMYRAVFNMYVIDGYKHKEIAENLGISVGTSKSNLSKARAKLQKMVLNSRTLKIAAD